MGSDVNVPEEAAEAVAVFRLGPNWKGLVRGKDTPARRQAEQEKKAKEEALLAEIRTELQAAAPAIRSQERERVRATLLGSESLERMAQAIANHITTDDEMQQDFCLEVARDAVKAALPPETPSASDLADRFKEDHWPR